MKSSDLKEYIINNECVDTILEELGCKNITPHVGSDSDSYYTCANPDGNNKNAVIVYLNENLTTINYTRNIIKDKRIADIFDLVSFYNDCSFPESLRYVHNILGLDYYKEPDDIPESLQILKMLRDMSIGDDEEDDCSVKPISEDILGYYLPYGSKMWEDSNVSLETQRLFELSFDSCTNSVAIPIRDELGTLVAVKARRLEYNPDIGESKYFFLEPGPKSLILYGLYQNLKSIQEQGVVYVGESEKFVHQLYDMGYYGVSTGGSKVSKRQVEMLTRLGVKIVFCFDKDILEEDLQHIACQFMNGVDIYAIIDRDNILNEKESPSDNPQRWCHLVKNNVYKIKGGESDG